MQYVEFYINTSGRNELIGEITLESGKLIISDDLLPYWQASWSYHLLGEGGYETMYDPEKILERLQYVFTGPELTASEVKQR